MNDSDSNNIAGNKQCIVWNEVIDGGIDIFLIMEFCNNLLHGIVNPFLQFNTDIQYAFADYAKYEIMNCYGIMNRITGKPITLALYSDINMISKNLFEVQDPESYDWYLVDTQGNVVSKK